MTQNLIITNDDTEFCQFTVEIPDGYGSFSIDSINGTLINQCFLHVGDKIQFKLANNPIKHEDVDFNVINNETREVITINTIELDTFKMLRIKYLPIYSFFHPSLDKFVFVINPSDDDVIREEPINAPSLYQVTTGGQWGSFTGRYAISFEDVVTNSNVDVIFGESINNSKTTLEDMGTYNEAGGIIPDNIQSSTYSMGSTWRYPVSNLLLSHKLFTTYEKTINNTLSLAIYKDVEGTLSTTSDLGNIGGETSNNQGVIANDYKVYDYSGLTPTLYTTPVTLPTNINQQLQKYVGIYNGTDYVHLSNVQYIEGSDLSDVNNHYCEVTIDEQTHSATFTPINFEHLDSVNYKIKTVRVRALSTAQGNPIIKNAQITFDDYIDNGHYQYVRTRIVRGGNGYVCHVNGNPQRCWFIIPIGTTRGSRYESQEMSLILGPQVQTDDDGYFSVSYLLSTGLLPPINYNTITEEGLTTNGIPIPLQLFNKTDNKPAIDDLTFDVIDGNKLRISLPPLNNDTYKIKITDDQFDGVEHVPLKGAGNVDPKVFIPLKAPVQLLNVPDVINDTITPGLLLIPDVMNKECDNLVDSNAAVFFADGHETLIVDEPKEDDMKFKTFNGSVVFDRSAARILRLMGSSPASSAIGYINDILSAKLSRYYFISALDIFDTFFNTSSMLTIPATIDGIRSIFNTYQNKTHTKTHALTFASFFDVIKLLSYENSVNNCMPSLTVEEHKIKANPLTIDELSRISLTPQNLDTFTFKTSHYYNSAFDTMPYFGLSINDERFRSVGGVEFSRLKNDYYNSNVNDKYINTSPEIFITNEERTKEVWNTLEDESLFVSIYKGMFVPTSASRYSSVNGCVVHLPVYRVYQNANFEQSDLSITTGHMKTLFPIYLQVASRVNIHNIGYYFDMIFNLMTDRFKSIGSSLFNYFNVLPTTDANHYVLRRFGISDDYNVTASFDSLWILNYLTAHSLNDYVNSEEVIDSLPTSENRPNNEELIDNLITTSMATNVQLFTLRYFNFYDNVSILNMVSYTQKINQNVNMTPDDLLLYFAQTEDDRQRKTNSHGKQYMDLFYSSVISNSNVYNRPKTAMTFIPKLGEFLDFPKIIFGVTLDFNTSRTVDIRYSNITHYRSPFITEYKQKVDPITHEVMYYYQEEKNNFEEAQKQKQNVSLFGVIFKYHQLSLGWQQMLGDFQQQFTISKARGNKHFVMVLVDEFGRMIPNMDTSQGFKNNLKLEITLNADLPQITRNQQV